MKLNFKREVLIVFIISLGPTLINVLGYYGFGICEFSDNPKPMDFALGGVFSLLVTSTLYFGCKTIIDWLHKVLPWDKNITKRILTEIVLVFSYTSTAQYILILIFKGSIVYQEVEWTSAFVAEQILFGNTVTLIVVAILEGEYFLRKWRESLVNAERLKTENIQSQYDSLKAQLDPHFLFNSLNVLSSLIEKDSEKAKQFIEDFAKVYRYVLEVKNEMVVPLRSELQFMDSYINLQKIRFEDGLHVKRNIQSQHLDQYVLPLSLQEVVGNAIKHNEVSSEKPLVIEIISSEDGVLVKNNLQLRTEKVESTGVGLNNLTKRYHLLSSHKPDFRILDLEYQATLPLIEAEI